MEFRALGKWCWVLLGGLLSLEAALGAGNPILLVGTSSNQFSFYNSEILRAEGLNAFDTADISAVRAPTLSAYDVVILGQVPLSSTQVTMFTNWVNSGGNLIAMRPDKQLATLLGIGDTGTTLSNGYLLVNTSGALHSTPLLPASTDPTGSTATALPAVSPPRLTMLVTIGLTSSSVLNKSSTTV